MTIIKRVLIDAGGGSLFLRRLDLSVLCAPDFDFAASHPTVAAAKMREHKERGCMMLHLGVGAAQGVLFHLIGWRGRLAWKWRAQEL
eukprot:scaffold853_cov104-Skeletonema_marinoi.AAC.6